MWRIKWKDFHKDDLLITESQGKFLNKQLVLDEATRGEDRFTLNEIAYRYDAIDVVEPTNKREEDDIKLLFGSEAEELKSGPLLDSEGYVIANWYKRDISSQEYEKYYAGHPSYYSLGRTDTGSITIAFRRVEEMNSIRPSHLELCTEEEANRMWKYSTAH